MKSHASQAKPPLLPWLLPVAAFALPLVLTFAAKGTVLLLALVSLGGLAESVRLQRLPLPSRAVLAVLALMMVWGGLSALWEATPGLALPKLAQLVGLSCLGIAALGAAAPLAPAQRARVVPALVCGLALVALIVVEERLTNLALRRWLHDLQGHPLHVNPWVEMFTYKTATAVGGVLAVLAASTGVHGRRWLVVLGAGSAALVMALVTKSLAGLVAVGAGCALVAVGGRWAPRMLAVALIAGFAAAPFAAQLPSTEQLVHQIKLPTSAAHRIVIWKFSATKAMERPLLGWGLDAARELPGGDVSEWVYFDKTWRAQQPVLPLHPHNMFIHVWLELGGVGAVLAALLLLAVSRAVARRGVPAVATMGAALLVSATSFGAWQSWWLAVVWLLAVLASAVTPEEGAA